METITWESVLVAAGILVGVCGLIGTIWKGVEAWKKLTHVEERRNAEAAQNQEIAQIKEDLRTVENRLNDGDDHFRATRNDMTEVLNVLNSMLMHFISGNDHEKLRGVKEKLDQYMALR